jgi:putative acetyltransferase
MKSVRIRAEAEQDASAIAAVTQAAFAGHPHSRQTEHHIVAALSAAGALLVSLVAEAKGEVIGHVAFSPVRIDGADMGWVGLGPVSVRPDQQGRGIGTRLVEAGLAAVRNLGKRGCVLVGEPGFYGRFGFRPAPGLVLPDVPPEYFLALSFADAMPRGIVAFHPGFQADGPS